jgi:hypothetical protein
MNLDGFNPNDVPTTTLIPAGKYRAVISASEEKQTKSASGSYLALTLTIIDGDHENRKVFARLNLNNPNDVASGIARQHLAQICKAVGVLTPQDSSDLHDIPMLITVTVRPAKGEYEESNDVKKYESAISTGDVTVPSGGPKKSPAPAAKPDAATPPWQRKK